MHSKYAKNLIFYADSKFLKWAENNVSKKVTIKSIVNT